MSLIALICIFWWIPNATQPPHSGVDLPPALIPTIAMSVCLITALLLVIQALAMPADKAADLDDEFGTEATGVDGEVLVNLVILLAVATVAWLVMDCVGFEPAMTLFLLVTFLFLRSRNWAALGLTAVLAPIILSQTVWFLFSTELPFGTDTCSLVQLARGEI